MAYIGNMFAVLAEPGNASLAQAIVANYPNDHFEIRAGQWLVAASGTAKEISDRLGITPNGVAGSAVIISFSGYYGLGSTQLWEWIAAKIGRPVNA